MPHIDSTLKKEIKAIHSKKQYSPSYNSYGTKSNMRSLRTDEIKDLFRSLPRRDLLLTERITTSKSQRKLAVQELNRRMEKRSGQCKMSMSGEHAYESYGKNKLKCVHCGHVRGMAKMY